MAFKIDPDAVPLYKELKPVHAAFKKAIKQQPADHIIRILMSVFASTMDRVSVTDKSYNSHEDLVWVSPVRASSIGAVFNVKLTVHLDDDSNATSADMQDQWIYGALLPLGLKIELHEAWKHVLLHATRLIKESMPEHVPLFNIWDEKTLIEHLGWLPNEDGTATVVAVDDTQAEVARHAIRALHNEAATVTKAWPNISPWLNAMQTLSTAPEDQSGLSYTNTLAWKEWSSNLKQIFLTSGLHDPVDLPSHFSVDNLNA